MFQAVLTESEIGDCGSLHSHGVHVVPGRDSMVLDDALTQGSHLESLRDSGVPLRGTCTGIL
jgi:hypothetical protein